MPVCSAEVHSSAECCQLCRGVNGRRDRAGPLAAYPLWEEIQPSVPKQEIGRIFLSKTC